MSKERVILYRMSTISSIKNKFMRRVLMVVFLPILFVINIMVTLLITSFMAVFIFVTSALKNNKVLIDSIKEKW